MIVAPTGDDGPFCAEREAPSGANALSEERASGMAVESSGHSRGNPRLYELIEHAPKTGPSPTVWAFPQLVEYLKVAAQPVQGPWPPHQHPRPDPEAESMPVAIADPAAVRRPED